tara:strand:+ start:586 stop:954 length:369 start_codon:yes stop_codon:yes gene_type:complete
VLTKLDHFSLEDIYEDRLAYETVERVLPKLKPKTVQLIRILRFARHYIRSGGQDHLEIPVSEIADTLALTGVPDVIGKKIEHVYQNKFPWIHSITMQQLEEHELELIRQEIMEEYELEMEMM